MTDNQRAQTKEYRFSLIRTKPECKIQPTFVDFQPLYMGSTSTGGIVPVFNDDHCHFTPAFLLPSQKKTQGRGLQTEKLLFDHRVRQTISSSESDKMEDLAPASNYCQICHEHFKNYDQHLEQKTHILRWHHNEFNQDIDHLCHLVEEGSVVSVATPKRKMIKKREKSDHTSNTNKASPKTSLDNYPKRKMSESEESVSYCKNLIQDSFKL